PEPDREEKRDKNPQNLSDLHVEAVGLVRRGANRRPFYVVKGDDADKESQSNSGGGSMSDEKEFPELVKELEGAEAFSDKIVAAFGALGERIENLFTAKQEDEPGPAPEQPPEPEPEVVDYSAQIEAAVTAAEETFTAKLKEERDAREAAEAQLEEAERARRLQAFTEEVKEKYAALATGEPEQFAADLMAFQDGNAGEEEYGRLVAVLEAANEAISTGGLYEQYATGGTKVEVGGSPFLAKVKQVQAEKYADKGAAGFALALAEVEREHPELVTALVADGLPS
ncbi:MAG: hypothetical protein ACYS8L_08040, partial [Planctomycetota bacterium]